MDEAPGDRYLRAFGNVVRTQRKSKKLTQNDLAYELETKRTYITGIESGTRKNLCFNTIFSLSLALETTPADLFAKVESILGWYGAKDQTAGKPDVGQSAS